MDLRYRSRVAFAIETTSGLLSKNLASSVVAGRRTRITSDSRKTALCRAK